MMKRFLVIVTIMFLFTACSFGPDSSTGGLRVDITRLEERVETQQEVIVSITQHFVELSNDYVLLERRVEALEDG